MSAFAAALDALYADPNLGFDVLWSPKGGGGPHALRALRGGGDQPGQLNGLGQLNTPVRHFMVRHSEVLERAPDRRPEQGDVWTLVDDGERAACASAPRRADDFRLQWTINLAVSDG